MVTLEVAVTWSSPVAAAPSPAITVETKRETTGGFFLSTRPASEVETVCWSVLRVGISALHEFQVIFGWWVALVTRNGAQDRKGAAAIGSVCSAWGNVVLHHLERSGACDPHLQRQRLERRADFERCWDHIFSGVHLSLCCVYGALSARVAFGPGMSHSTKWRRSCAHAVTCIVLLAPAQGFVISEEEFTLLRESEERSSPRGSEANAVRSHIAGNEGGGGAESGELRTIDVELGVVEPAFTCAVATCGINTPLWRN